MCEMKKEEKSKEDKIGDALLKVALGYQVSEVTEEYAEVDGALKLTKRKKTKKDVPPDLKAVQMLLSSGTAESFLLGRMRSLNKRKIGCYPSWKRRRIRRRTSRNVRYLGAKRAMERRKNRRREGNGYF